MTLSYRLFIIFFFATGNFVLKKEMRTELVVPDFTNFKVNAILVGY